MQVLVFNPPPIPPYTCVERGVLQHIYISLNHAVISAKNKIGLLPEYMYFFFPSMHACRKGDSGGGPADRPLIDPDSFLYPLRIQQVRSRPGEIAPVFQKLHDTSFLRQRGECQRL